MRSRIDPFVFVALLLGLILFLPLFQPGLPAAPDAVLHFFRTALWRWAWADGVMWPRWHTLLYQGYGYPALSFNGPFFYSVAAFLSTLAADVLTGYKIAVLFSCLAYATGMYLWAREVLGRAAAIVAAAAYTFATIRFRELYFIGGYGQFMAWSLYPWILFFWLRLARRPSRGAYIGAVLALASLVLTHNISAMLFIPVFAVYLLILAAVFRSPRTWGLLIAGGVAALLLSAIFWLPAFAEMQFTRAYVLTGGHWDVQVHFVRLADLLARSVPLDARAVNPPLPFNFGRLHLVLAGLGLLTILLPGQPALRRIHLALAAVVVVFAAFMMLPASLPVWRGLPIIAFAEYPWRWFGVAFVFSSLLAGAAMNWLARWPTLRLAAAGLCIVALIIVSAVYQFPKPFVPVSATRSDFLRYERAYRAVGTTAGGEFLTPWTIDVPAAPAITPDLARRALVAAPPGVQASVLEERATGLRLAISADEATSVSLAQFYFPGWRAMLDGQPIALRPAPRTGLIELDIPAGRHELQVEFRDTPVRTAATVAALAGLLLLCVPVALWRQATPPIVEPSVTRSEPVRHRAELLIGALLLLVGSLGVLWIGPRTSGFRVVSPPGRALPVQHAVDLPVGEQVRLIGYDVDRNQVPSGGELRVRLYWQAAGPLSEDYASFVQLVAGPERRVFAQSDRTHPGFIPTSTWTDAQYVVDEHLIRIPPETPPIAFDIVAGLYRPGTPVQLGSANLPGTIDVMPTAPPDTKAVDRGSATRFGEDIRLLGHVVAVQGDALLVTLYWQASRSPSADYQVFLHLVDGAGQQVGQADGPPLMGCTPRHAGCPAKSSRIHTPSRGRHVRGRPASS